MSRLAASSSLRLEQATLIDGTGAAPIPDAVIIANSDGIIEYAGAAATAPPRDGSTQVIQAPDCTVLPGFIDCHVHLCMPPDRSGVADRIFGDPAASMLRSTRWLRTTLDAGITTVRDLGGLPAGFRTVVEEGYVEGPRLQVAVRVLGHTGGHFDFKMLSGYDLAKGLVEIVDTVDEARLAARVVIREGADVIKVASSGGMGSPSDSPHDEGLYEHEMAAIVEEARRHGDIPVASHAQGLAGIRAAIKAQVTSIEHGYFIDDECCDLLGERGGFLVPTLSTMYGGLDKSRLEPWHYEKKLRWVEESKENIAAAIQRGVQIALGTDAPLAPHGTNLEELAHLVELGMRPIDAITAGTLNAARLLRIDHELGTLERGKLADLVVCSGDPLADITVLSKPSNIMLVAQQGVIRRNSLPDLPNGPTGRFDTEGGA
ncbi:amidohydrolase family protein [Streptomyces sp. CLV115]|uniref:metal-dependent hydrolase family protein n=1 Tax=Streptomyces sp. CLV115 TaxID=3138502 RepID=UPI00313C6703